MKKNTNKKTMSFPAICAILCVLAVVAIITVVFLVKSFSPENPSSPDASGETGEIATSGQTSEETNETNEIDSTDNLSGENNNNGNSGNDDPVSNANENTAEYNASNISKYLTMSELKEAVSDPYLKLININSLLSGSYTPSTANAYGIPLDTRVAPHFRDMMAAAKKAGHTDLAANSGYRSYKKQTELYNRKINLFKSKGYNEKEATQKAGEIVAKPGSSEHQYGMSADICDSAITSKYGNLNEAFAETSTYKWLITHSADYGFVLRYPEDKYSITKIVYEPWHYRYVGKKHAKIMNEKNFCLEEYTNWLQENYNKFCK